MMNIESISAFLIFFFVPILFVYLIVLILDTKSLIEYPLISRKKKILFGILMYCVPIIGLMIVDRKLKLQSSKDCQSLSSQTPYSGNEGNSFD